MPLFLLDPSPIFPGRRTGQALTDIKKPWAKIRDRARLGDVRLHDFRRTFAAAAAAADGLSLHQIGQLLGHRNPRTTARYSDLTDHPARKAAERVGEALSKAMGKDEE